MIPLRWSWTSWSCGCRHRLVSLEAELRQSAQEIASILQESLLPPHLPAIAGLDMAARYHVAYNDQVGGDFYE